MRFGLVLNKPYKAKVLIAKDGDALQKVNAIDKVDGLGRSSFFPDSWTRARIIEEVEFAIKNNTGKVAGTSNEYRGISKSGINIGFYYNEKTGEILSYFPIIN